MMSRRPSKGSQGITIYSLRHFWVVSCPTDSVKSYSAAPPILTPATLPCLRTSNLAGFLARTQFSMLLAAVHSVRISLYFGARNTRIVRCSSQEVFASHFPRHLCACTYATDRTRIATRKVGAVFLPQRIQRGSTPRKMDEGVVDCNPDAVGFFSQPASHGAIVNVALSDRLREIWSIYMDHP